MGYCPDCGSKTSSGICSNCQEELYILTFQSEWVEGVSSEFTDKAAEQQRYLERREASGCVTSQK